MRETESAKPRHSRVECGGPRKIGRLPELELMAVPRLRLLCWLQLLLPGVKVFLDVDDLQRRKEVGEHLDGGRLPRLVGVGAR